MRVGVPISWARPFGKVHKSVHATLLPLLNCTLSYDKTNDACEALSHIKYLS